MFKTLEVKMLPSVTGINYANDNATVIGLHRADFLYLCKCFDEEIETIYKPQLYKPQHLYVISNEEMLHGDYYLDLNSNTIKDTKMSHYPIRIINSIPTNIKVIATTDKTLNLPEIGINFIQKYIKAFNDKQVIKYVSVEFNVVTMKISKNLNKLDIYVNGFYNVSVDKELTTVIDEIIQANSLPKLTNNIISIKTKSDVDSEKMIKIIREFGETFVDNFDTEEKQKAINDWIEINI